MLLGALATLVTEMIVTAGSSVVNPDRIADAVASGSDFQVIERIMQLPDQGSSLAMATNFQPPAPLWQIMHADNGTAASLGPLRSLGAVDLRDLSLQITLTNHRREPVRILDIKLIDVQRRAPLAGTVFYAPPQEGDADLLMMTDFDQAVPQVDSILPANGPIYRPGQPYFDSHTISLSSGEQQVLMYRAHVTKSSVTFRLQLDYLIGGTEKSQVIDQGGKPFALTGVHTTPADGRWSYQRVFAMGNNLQYCQAPDPATFSPDTAVNC